MDRLSDNVRMGLRPHGPSGRVAHGPVAEPHGWMRAAGAKRVGTRVAIVLHRDMVCCASRRVVVVAAYLLVADEVMRLCRVVQGSSLGCLDVLGKDKVARRPKV